MTVPAAADRIAVLRAAARSMPSCPGRPGPRKPLTKEAATGTIHEPVLVTGGLQTGILYHLRAT